MLPGATIEWVRDMVPVDEPLCGYRGQHCIPPPSKSQYKLDIGSESTTSAPKPMDRNRGANGSTKIIVPWYSKNVCKANSSEFQLHL